MLTEDQAREMLIQARKRGATRDYAIIGIDDDATKNPFDAQQAPPTGTGELNTIYARINGNPDPQTVYYDPAMDMRILAHGARVLIEWIDGQPWVLGADKIYLTQQQNGAPLPTHNLPLRQHDHTTTDEGGALGANTVDSTQIVAGAVTEAKIDTGAVTNAKLATDAVTNAKVANDAIDTAEIVNGAVTNAKLATNAVDTTNILDDAVTPTKTDGLTGASAALVAQTAADAFTSIPYTLTSNTKLYYDGTRIRQGLRAIEQPNTTAAVANSTTEVDIMTVSFSATTFSNANWLRFMAQLLITGTVVSDIYFIYLKYWDGTTYSTGGLYTWTTFIANVAIWQSYTFNIPQFILSPAPAASGGNYLWKLSFLRNAGTGQASINRGVASFMTAEET